MTPVLDDRSWPAYAMPLSAIIVLGSLGLGASAAIGSAANGWGAALAVTAVFVAGLVLTATLVLRAALERIAGRPTPWWTVAGVGAVCLGAILSPVAGGSIAAAAWSGLLGGAFGGNLVAIRRARANRPQVDAAAALRAAEDEAHDGREAQHRSVRSSALDVRLPELLGRRVLTERNAVTGWLLAGLIVLGVGAAADAPTAAIVAVAVTAATAMVWVARRLWAAWLAHRDHRTASTPPRRAFVVLLHDPAPRNIRPLLGIWSERPTVADGAFPKPEAVYRCDEEADDLLSSQGDVVVHEAWVDTGPRATSKPRWVVGNDGIALPHRRGILFGRWYFHALTRSERPARPDRLEVAAPDPDRTAVVSSAIERPGLVGAVTWRAALLALVGALGAVVFR